MKIRSDLATLLVGTIALVAAACLTAVTGSAPAELWQLAVLLIGGALGLSLPLSYAAGGSSSSASTTAATSSAAAKEATSSAPVVTLTQNAGSAQ